MELLAVEASYLKFIFGAAVLRVFIVIRVCIAVYYQNFCVSNDISCELADVILLFLSVFFLLLSRTGVLAELSCM